MDLINQYYVAVPTPVEPWTGIKKNRYIQKEDQIT